MGLLILNGCPVESSVGLEFCSKFETNLYKSTDWLPLRDESCANSLQSMFPGISKKIYGHQWPWKRVHIHECSSVNYQATCMDIHGDSLDGRGLSMVRQWIHRVCLGICDIDSWAWKSIAIDVHRLSGDTPIFRMWFHTCFIDIHNMDIHGSMEYR